MLERKDIISDEAIMAPAVLTKELEKLLSMLEKVQTTVRTANEAIGKSSGTAEIKSNIDQLTASEKEVIKIQNQLSTALAKSNDEYVEYKRLVNDVNKAVNDKVKYGNINAQQATKENSSLTQLNLALQKNRQAYAQLRTEQERQSKSGKELLAIIQKQDIDVKELNSTMGKTGLVMADTGEKTNMFQKALQGLPGSLGAAAQGMWALVKASVAFILTPIGLVLAAIGAALFALMSYFKGSEEGQNRLNRIVQIGKAIFEQFMNVVEDIGEALYDAFTNPKQALLDFWEALKKNVVNRIVGLLELFPALGKAIALAFRGEWAEAGKVAVNALAKVATGVDDIIGKVEEFIDTTEKMVEQGVKFGEATAKRMRQIDREERKLIVDREKFALKVAELREKAVTEEGENKRKYIMEAIALEQQLSDREVALAKLRLSLAQLELKANGDDKEALKKVAEAQAAVYAAERARFDNTLKFRKQIEGLDDKAEKDDKRKLDIEKEIIKFGRKVYEEELKQIDGIRLAAINGAVSRKEAEKDIAQVRKDLADDLIQAQIDGLEKLLKAEATTAEEKAIIDQKLFELRSGLINAYYNQIDDTEKTQLQKTEEFLAKTTELYENFASTISGLLNAVTDRRVQKIDEEIAKVDEQLQRDLKNAGDNEAYKEQLEAQAFSRTQQLEKRKREEQRKTAVADKALNITKAIIDTASAVTEALPNIPLSILVGALGAVQVATIAAQPIPKFAEGVRNFEGGLAIVGEEGPEAIRVGNKLTLSPGKPTLVDLPKGADVIPNEDTMKMLAMQALYNNAKIDSENYSLYGKLDTMVKEARDNTKKITKAIADAAPGNLYAQGLLTYEQKIKEDRSRENIRRTNLGG